MIIEIARFTFIIFYGLCAGSFASLLSYRWPRGMNWTTDRSRCPYCREKLAVRDLMPLASWMINGAKCRFCQAPVSVRYPLLEIVSAILAVMVYHFIGWQWMLLPALIAQPFVLASAFIFFQAIRSTGRGAGAK